MQKQPSEGFFKKGLMRNLAEFTRKHLYRNPFLVFSCDGTGYLLLIIVVPIEARGALTNETVNYETRTKAYVLI